MREVLLSHDDKVSVYIVPDEAAQNLEAWCLEFAVNWIWHDPNGRKLIRQINGIDVAVYGVSDFIDYLNTWAFPDQQSKLVKTLDYYDYELPEEYKKYPQFNF